MVMAGALHDNGGGEQQTPENTLRPLSEKSLLASDFGEGYSVVHCPNPGIRLHFGNFEKNVVS